MPHKKERPLTLKQRRFIAELQKNKFNATQAALKTYDTTYNTASYIGHENLKKPKIRKEVERLLTGIEEKAHQVVINGLQANKQTAYEGEIIESEHLADYSERRKMLNLVADMAGWKAPKTIEKTELKLSAKYEALTEQQLQAELNKELDKLGLTPSTSPQIAS